MRNEKMKKTYDDLTEGFDLLPAIEVIVQCNSISALNSLKKVIDRRIERINTFTLK